MCSAGMVRIAVSRAETARHQTALRGRALTRSHVRTASSLPPSGECWTSRLRNLFVPTNRSRKSMSSASAEERRATRPAPWESRPACTFGVAWLLPRRLPLVFTRSSGRNSLAARCPSDVGAIEDGLLWVRCSVLRSPARGPIQAERGRTCAAARRIGSMTYRNNLVLRGRRGCPSSPCSSPGRAEGSSWSLRFHECRNFLTSNACCFRHR